MNVKKSVILSLITLSLFISCKSGFNSDNKKSKYYVDLKNGNDRHTGVSPDKAWKSLQRIPQQKLKAGDQIYLSGNSHFQGSLKLSGLEGTKEAPIIIGTFGQGKAILESGDSLGVLAQKCKYLKIKNIQVSGSGRLKGNGTNGIELLNCKFCEIDSVTANGYLYSGIRVTGGNDIRITNCRAYDNGFCGINADSGEKDYGIDGSSFKTLKRIYIGYSIADNNPGCPAVKDNHSGNGILLGGVSNGIIEYCEARDNGWDMPREGNGPVGIWAYMSDSITIQYCYSHHNKTSAKGKDGGGFDFDGGMKYSVMQYNLSAFNEGAGYGIFQYGGATDWTGNTVRYCISYNDGSKNGQCGILVWCDPSAVKMSAFHAYNNTIVNDHGYGINFEPGAYKDFLFENNIILVSVTTSNFIGGQFTLAAFNSNLYWSDFIAARGTKQPKVIADKSALYSDPKLNLPSDSILLQNTLYTPDSKYFMLREGSVCTGSGKKIDNNGGSDFWKNRIMPGARLNIGAFQGKI